MITAFAGFFLPCNKRHRMAAKIAKRREFLAAEWQQD
jgi:hypothetical protein